MNQIKYDEIINDYAQRAIKDEPNDPRQMTMEYANGELVEGFISVEEIFKYTHSRSEAEAQWTDTFSFDRDFCVAVDCVDWDLCKRIGQLEKELIK